MATITELGDQKKVVFRWKVPLGPDPDDQHLRRFFVALTFIQWIKDGLPNVVATSWGGDLPAKDQVMLLLKEFQRGDPLDPSRQFHVLRPHQHGVWELKTGDVRIFGWFPEFDCFVAVTGDDAFVAKSGQYPTHIAAVLAFRNEIDLNAPKFIAGGNPADVVSFRGSEFAARY